MRHSLLICALVLTTAASALTFDAIAAGDQSVAARATAKLAPASPVKTAAAPAIPQQYLYLIRATLGALHDANTSGNYTVLRDLAAPSFQAKHSAADLTEIFAAARRKPVDLSGAAFATPTLADTARPTPATLHLRGHLPLTLERLAFTLSYEAINGHWRLAAISIATEAAPELPQQRARATQSP
jgi:hypothetical protein